VREGLAPWFLETYPKLRNPSKVRRLLAALSDDEVSQLRHGLAEHAPRYLSKKNAKGWRFVPYADSYLEDGIYWEFRPPKASETRATNGHGAEEARARAAASDAKQEAERKRWQLRAAVISRLLAEGVPQPKHGSPERDAFEQRVEDEIASMLPAPELPS
jgi:hypothetical protein